MRHGSYEAGEGQPEGSAALVGEREDPAQLLCKGLGEPGAMRWVNQGERFDLLVTDRLMPGMSGIDLANAISAGKPGLPVLLVSGYAENEGIEPGLPRLTKPFRKDELAASLAQLRTGPEAVG